jgi:hypothetical protein
MGFSRMPSRRASTSAAGEAHHSGIAIARSAIGLIIPRPGRLWAATVAVTLARFDSHVAKAARAAGRNTPSGSGWISRYRPHSAHRPMSVMAAPVRQEASELSAAGYHSRRRPCDERAEPKGFQ